MIAHLIGTVAQKYHDTVTLDVNGVGYQVFAPSTVLHDLTVGETTTIYTYHHIREDAQLLFGFDSQEDKDFFILLTSVSGVGPKVGLKILSTLSPAQFAQAILKDNLPTLTSVSGVGKKMAERLVVELKDKVPEHLIADANATDSIAITPKVEQEKDDVFQALKSLGYSSDEIKKAYHRAAMDLKQDLSVEQSMKVLLKHL